MKRITVCAYCGGTDIKMLTNSTCYCNKCKKEHSTVDRFVETNPFKKLLKTIFKPL